MSTKYVFNKYFNGEKNFMTPRVYGYKIVSIDEDRQLYIEKSKDSEGTLYGCTVLLRNPKTCEVKRIDLSKSFSSPKEVNQYIDGITVEMVNEAYIYGEVKVI